MANDAPAPKWQRSDAIGAKFIEKTGDLQAKAVKKAPGLGGKADDEEQPAGGYDDTPVPKLRSGYTVKFTFHRAKNLPAADISTFSSDPYIMAQLYTSVPPRHREDPKLLFRTPTIRRNCSPEWNSEWIVANIPPDGFKMKARLYDEDPGDHDDRLGNVHIMVNSMSDKWEGFRERSFGIEKRMGSKRAYLFRGCTVMFRRGVHMSGEVIISAEVLGKSDASNGGRVYTVGPCHWTRHFSPLIGRLAGTKEPVENKDGKKSEHYSFEATQIQLKGPVPEHMYHRYVEFRPFVAGMFTRHSLRGRILNRALRHQHARIYNYSQSTVYGVFPEPSEDMSLKFLNMVHFDDGGRIFTYILTLDGQWRFTETGKQFGIDLLSKHTMHSNVSIYTAFSGEFFIRRLEDPRKKPEEQKTHPPDDVGHGPPDESPPKDVSLYQLIIDNDSGTYRPNKDLLPQLQKFMEQNLPGLKVTTLDCQGDKERLDKMKDEQRERHKTEGDYHTCAPGDTSRISSSNEKHPDAAVEEAKHGTHPSAPERNAGTAEAKPAEELATEKTSAAPATSQSARQA